MRSRTLIILIGIVAIVAAGVFLVLNNGEEAAPPPDPVQLLTESADNIRASDTFRMEVTHSGVDYLVSVYLGTDESGLSEAESMVAFRRALAQYIAPNILHADVSIILGGLTTQLQVFSEGDDQWFKLPITRWINIPFAPGFNPQTLIAEDTGFQAALAALTDLVYKGTTTLEDGTGVYHLSGTANGPDVTDLLVGLIEPQGLVPVDVYIDRSSRFPVRLVITQPETDPVDPTTWTIDVYDVDAEPDIPTPEALSS